MWPHDHRDHSKWCCEEKSNWAPQPRPNHRSDHDGERCKASAMPICQGFNNLTHDELRNEVKSCSEDERGPTWLDDCCQNDRWGSRNVGAYEGNEPHEHG